MSSTFPQHIADATVTPEMLEEVTVAISDEVQARGGKTDDPMWIIYRTFWGRDINPLVTTAIFFRMQALSELINAGELSEWQLPGQYEHGAVMIGAEVFRAAAAAKLILTDERGDSPRFEPSEFRQLVLAAAKPDGRC
ncbi:hypothetical protein ATY81_26950 [Rhizobium sp. R72]|uniref:hypothetical protein n=1 Tax=unclassified Rhizobium TaxID=2613769 RepID=UPI000B52AEFA|nr:MULTISPECIES: hypothetical protein [unclassified Rhizobium]OWV98667.1 hypothetical protein ATY81_26950 [Rhizobium sp. R72]OWV98701.1 hypothetical protein ATY80_26950 [Rhizobium sp. R711]